MAALELLIVALLKSIIEDAISGQIVAAPKTMISAESSATVTASAQAYLDAWKKAHP